MRRSIPIFYSALLLTGVNLLLRFSGTGFHVYICSKLGAESIGLLQLILSIGALSTTVSIAGVRTGAMYLTAEETGRKHQENIHWVLSGCFLYSIIVSTLSVIVLTTGAPYIAQRWIGNPQTTSVIRLIAAFIPVNCLCNVMIGYFTGANRIGALSVVEIAEQLCSMAVTVILLSLWAHGNSIRSCASVILGSSTGACLTLLLLIILRVFERSTKAAPIPVRSRLLQITVPLAIADDLKCGLNTLESLMVPKRLALHKVTASPLSAFGTICGMVFPILMFPAAIIYALAELLIPELARCNAAGSQSRIKYLTRRSLRIAMLYGCIFSGLMILAADTLCLQLYKSADAGFWLKRYALLIPMLYCDAITDAMTKGLGQQKICVRYNIITAALDVAFLYLLLPQYGMTGYFISFTITHILNFGLSLRRLLKITNRKPRFHIIMITLAVTAASVVICYGLTSRVFSYLAYPVILLSALTLFGVIGKADLIWIRQLIKNKRA